MSPKTLVIATIAPLLLAATLAVRADEQVTTTGIDVEVRQYINETSPGQSGPDLGADVQDFGDGTTDEGGPPEADVDLRDAALEGEKNMGPNAPGYIP